LVIELSENAKRCLDLAKKIAVSLGHSSLDSGHLLLGILADAASKPYIVLESMGIQRYEVEQELKNFRPPIGQFVEEPETSDELKSVLESAYRISQENNEEKISLELLFVLTLLKEDSTAGKIILNMDYDSGLIIQEMGFSQGESPVL